MNKELADELLTMLGKKLRQGEDVLAFYASMEALPESNSGRPLAVKAAGVAVEQWMAEVASETKRILG